MKPDRFVRFLLLVIAASLLKIAVNPYLAPSVVQAQSSDAYQVYVEPGTAMLRAPDGSRQVFGKVVVDLRNGNVWGFPTLGQDPYPSNATKTTPQTSHPFLLGKFAFNDMDK
jgi:hypothetical protein